MTTGADLCPVVLLAPEENCPPEVSGTWILDLRGLEPGAAVHRRGAFREAADRAGARLVSVEGGAKEEEPLMQALRTTIGGLGLRIELPALARYIPTVRRFVAGRVGDRFGARAAFSMELVLDELCINAIEHGSPFPSRYNLEVTEDSGILSYRVVNRPASREESRLESPRDLQSAEAPYLGERGRGLFLVGRMVDGLEIDTGDERVEVRAWKDLRGLAGS